MAAFDYQNLKKQYENFSHPIALLEINGTDISKDKAGFGVSDIEVEMTCGFEASMVTFWIFGCYDKNTSEFCFESLKKYIFMGSSLRLCLGYGSSVREVFRGFIARVNYVFREEDMPGVEVTAMDVKGIMMAGSYAKQLKATSFSEGVKEILQNTAYMKLKSSQIITGMNINDTPDKMQATGADQSGKKNERTIEMVGESDYEFVVKAAKKYNYEFFTVGGEVYFRKAKSNPEILMELGPGKGLRSFEVGYDMTGLVEEVEVRAMDAGKGKTITASKRLQGKVSQGNKAKPLLKNSQKVYIDPTVSTKAEADYRAEYLMEEISYRLGTLEAEFIGIPELTPGRFMKLTGLGTGPSNTFYLHTVRHIMDSDRGYITKVTGKAATMDSSGLGI